MVRANTPSSTNACTWTWRSTTRQSVGSRRRRRREDPSHRGCAPRSEVPLAAWCRRPAAARTEASPLAREGHEPFRLAVATAKPREPASQEAAAQEPAELVLDEARHAGSLSEPRGLGPERLEVVADDGVDHRCARVAWRVVGKGHASPGVPTRCHVEARRPPRAGGQSPAARAQDLLAPASANLEDSRSPGRCSDPPTRTTSTMPGRPPRCCTLLDLLAVHCPAGLAAQPAVPAHECAFAPASPSSCHRSQSISISVPRPLGSMNTPKWPALLRSADERRHVGDALEVVEAVWLRDVVGAAEDVEHRRMQLGEVALGQSAQPGIRAGADDAAVLQHYGLDARVLPDLQRQQPAAAVPRRGNFRLSIF